MKNFKGKQSVINTSENMDNSSESGGSKWIKITGALALIAALMGMGKIVNGQTLVNNKDYQNILKAAEKSQEAVGEDLFKFLFRGELQRRLQLEIEKQKNNPGKYMNKEFSVFKEDDIEPDTEDEEILSAKNMEDTIMIQIDSILTKDMARFYNAFHEYQKSGKNLVGKKRGKGDYMDAGWNFAEFPVNINIDSLINKDSLPYTKAEMENLRAEFEKIYETELSSRKTKSEKARKSMKKEEYEEESLKLLEQAKENIMKKIYTIYIKPFVKKYIEQFYSTKKDAK